MANTAKRNGQYRESARWFITGVLVIAAAAVAMFFFDTNVRQYAVGWVPYLVMIATFIHAWRMMSALCAEYRADSKLVTTVREQESITRDSAPIAFLGAEWMGRLIVNAASASEVRGEVESRQQEDINAKTLVEERVAGTLDQLEKLGYMGTVLGFLVFVGDLKLEELMQGNFGSFQIQGLSIAFGTTILGLVANWVGTMRLQAWANNWSNAHLQYYGALMMELFSRLNLPVQQEVRLLEGAYVAALEKRLSGMQVAMEDAVKAAAKTLGEPERLTRAAERAVTQLEQMTRELREIRARTPRLATPDTNP